MGNKRKMIRNVIFTGNFLISISKFPEKLQSHFTKISSVTMKLRRTWCNTMEVIRVAAIVKFQ